MRKCTASTGLPTGSAGHDHLHAFDAARRVAQSAGLAKLGQQADDLSY